MGNVKIEIKQIIKDALSLWNEISKYLGKLTIDKKWQSGNMQNKESK